MTERLTSVSCTVLRGWLLLNLIYVGAGEITIVSKMYAKHQPRSQANAKGVIPRHGTRVSRHELQFAKQLFAGVASVSVGLGSKERDIRCFARAKWGK